MKKFNLIFAVVALFAVACQNENTLDGVLQGFENPVVEQTHNEFNNLIAEQNGKFSDEEFINALTKSVLTYSKDDVLFYFDDGSVGDSVICEGSWTTNKFLFFDNGEYWACYDAFYMAAIDDFKPMDGAFRSEWSYDAETNVLTVFNHDWCAGQFGKVECKSEVLYFDGKQFIVKGKFYPSDSSENLHTIYAVRRFTIEDGRNEAIEKYSTDLREYTVSH